MTPQQILIVAVRLFAIFWFVVSLGHLVSAMRAIDQFSMGGLDRLVFAVPVLQLVVCAFLWLFPATLSRRLLKGGDEVERVESPVLIEWQSMAMVILGLWTLSGGIPDAVYYVAYFLSYDKLVTSLEDMLRAQWPYLAATIVQIAIGIWLVLGARGLAALLTRLRGAGLQP